MVDTNLARAVGRIGDPHEGLQQGGFADHRADGVDANLIGRELDGQGFGQGVHRPLGGVVPSQTWTGA